MKTTIEASILEEVPAEALEAILLEVGEEEYEEIAESIESIAQFIRNCYDKSEERTDSCYIYCDYSKTIGKWRFEVTGSSYRKDQSICNEELDEEITIVNVELEKAQKEAEKNKKASENVAKWAKFFEGKTKEEIFAKVSTMKFS